MKTERAVHDAISFAVQHPEDDRLVLIVLRPADDAELPNLWGLPAGSVRAGESAEEALLRAGREKLGVVLAPLRELVSGSTERRNYTLRMKLFAARIVSGSPSVPQPYPDVTQYSDLQWGSSRDLEPAAGRGSLCCRLFLETRGG
jgi:8-oxo-dGTP pyrophosphatase MutT (NUDIX family)